MGGRSARAPLPTGLDGRTSVSERCRFLRRTPPYGRPAPQTLLVPAISLCPGLQEPSHDEPSEIICPIRFRFSARIALTVVGLPA